MAGPEHIEFKDDRGLMEVESLFVGAMDAADIYVSSYERLHGRLKAAYFELARARYAMGVHSISPAQFSSQLEATKRIRVGNGKAEAPLLALEEDGGESLGLRRRSLSLTKQHAPIKEGYEKLELSTAKRYGVQRQYQGKDSLIASLEEKYVLSQCECEMPDNSSSSSESPEHLPQEPLHMLGGMVSPHLVQAKGLFTAAVKDVVTTVNARHCMAQTIAAYAELQSTAQSPSRNPG